MNNPIIRTENLVKTYGNGASATHALRGVTLEIPHHSFSCIVGPSGHGKSTLMHLIGGLDRPSGGSVAVSGAELTRLSSSELARLRGEKIGFVFQFFNLLRHLTALENIELSMMLVGRRDPTTRERAMQLLDDVGLADRAGARPGELSGGQQQRVAIARALANDPELLLLDEPTGNLDSVSEAQILELLHRMHERGKTLVVVTHNPTIAAEAGYRIEVRDGAVTRLN